MQLESRLCMLATERMWFHARYQDVQLCSATRTRLITDEALEVCNCQVLLSLRKFRSQMSRLANVEKNRLKHGFCLSLDDPILWIRILKVRSETRHLVSFRGLLVFEPIAPCHSRSWGIIACLALMPHRPVFHPSCADFVSPVSPVSLAARGFCLVVVFLVLVFVFWPGCVVFWVWLVLGFLFPVSLCFFACLSSFTDWCTAHRQQFREQKKRYPLGVYPNIHLAIPPMQVTRSRFGSQFPLL